MQNDMQIFWDNFNLTYVLREPDEITGTVFLLQLRTLTVYRCSNNSEVNCDSLICISIAGWTTDLNQYRK